MPTRATAARKGTPLTLAAHAIFISFCIFCLLPIITIISTSLTNEGAIMSKGYSVIPSQFSLVAYEYIFRNAGKLLNSYFTSASVTIVGTILGLLINAMIAYPLSRNDFRFRRQIAFYVFFTMLFSGGLVPWYIVITSLHMQDTFWVLVLPYLVAAWFVLLLRTFFQTIPAAIIESAKLDGCSEFGIFLRMILPLSKPALATVGLFIVFQYWNDYWLGLLFVTKENLISLQYMFFKTMASLDFYLRNATNLPPGLTLESLPKLSARMALCVLTAGPMLFVFPFFQKYFVKGLTVGSVKG